VKRKQEGALKIFSCYVKRWFSLDFKRHVFAYSVGPGKPEKTVIPFNV